MKDSSSAPVEEQAAYQSISENLMSVGYQSVSESERPVLPEYQNISEDSASLEYHNVSGSEGSLKCQNSYDKSRLKSLDDLNMLDSFLFSVSTEETKNAELIARIIIERATGIKLGEVIIETEKQFKGLDVDRRGIRLDLCISELKNGKTARVFDIEPNNYHYKSLPRRDRYYQSITDAKLLGKGMELTSFRNLYPYGYFRMIPLVKTE